MFYKTFLLITIIVPTIVSAINVGRSFAENAEDNSNFELLKKMETERLKAVVLDGLGLTELPAVSKSSSRRFDDALRLLLTNVEQPPQPQKNLARILYSPMNRDFKCLKDNVSSCRRFLFRVPQTAMDFTSEFWVYRVQLLPSETQTVSALCSHPEDEKELVLEHDLLLEEGDEKWLTFRLPMLKHLEDWGGNLNCSVEVTGMVIGEGENNLPFLKMTQDLEEAHGRRRRSSINSAEGGTCSLKPFKVSFEDIGLGNIILYPKSYNSHLCDGHCLGATTFAERIMRTYFEINETLEYEYGRCWSPCCKPEEYEPLQVIFVENVNGVDTFVDRSLSKMVVKSCRCS